MHEHQFSIRTSISTKSALPSAAKHAAKVFSGANNEFPLCAMLKT
jgi:hypothetical protein